MKMRNKSHVRLTKSNIQFVFFGTSEIAVFVLEELLAAGFTPRLVVTTPDTRRGRGLRLMPPPAKEWALKHGVGILQPEQLDDDFLPYLSEAHAQVFVVADYGKLIPKAVLAIPPRGVLNVHPSLLPRLRGPSPIKSAILNDDRATGVSIILLDEEMDHGPIVAQKRIPIAGWTDESGLARRSLGEGGPPRAGTLGETLARGGGKLLADILPAWIAGEIEAREQNHDIATYCEKIEKEDGLLDLSADAYKNLLKIRAFEGWPGTYAFFERGGKKVRVGILDAHVEGNNLVIDKVKPEGRREMGYDEFLRSVARPI